MKTHRALAVANVLSLAFLGAFACAPAEEPSEGGGGTGGVSLGTTGSGGRTGGSGPANTGGSTASASGGSGGSTSSSGGAAGSGSGGSNAQGGGSGGASASGGAGGSSPSTGGTSGAGGSSSPDAGGGETGAPPAAGEFTFTGDFEMKGMRLCFKSGNTRNTGQKAPELKWSGAPAGTLSFAVSLFDTSNGGTHWVIWNIPATATGLPAGISAATLPMGAQQSGAWYGPGAGGAAHKYEYKLWPLKVDKLPAADKNAMRMRILPMNVIGTEKTITAYGNDAANCGV